MKEPILAAVYEVSGTVCNTCVEIKLKFSTMVRHARRIHHDSASAKPDRKIARRREVELTHQQLSNLKKKNVQPPLPVHRHCKELVWYQALQRARAHHLV